MSHDDWFGPSGRRDRWLGACAVYAFVLGCSQGETPKPDANLAGNGGSAGTNAGASGGGGAGRSFATAGGGAGGVAGATAGTGNAGAGGGAGGGTGGGSAAQSGAGGSNGGAAGGANQAGAGSGGQLAGSGGEPSAGGASAGASGTAGGGTAGAAGDGAEPASLLVFSRTTSFRHTSIAVGISALTNLAMERGWTLTATEDPTLFQDSALAAHDAVVFLNNTGDVLDATQQAAFERYIRAGGGFVGIHAASDTEFDWPFFGALVGAYFSVHPDIQPATIRVEDPTHPATIGLPDPWQRTDEWYNFRTNPRANVNVLLTLDESSYSPGAGAMGADHPIAWCHEYEGGRSFYTALGHTEASYTEPLFLAHVAGGIEWVIAR
jgi:type 1 glutamine amidotransferase